MDAAVAAAISLARMGTPARDLETDRLEFKQEDRDVRRTLELVADAVICLANNEGGHVVLGVPDRPEADLASWGVRAVITVDTLRRGVFDRTRPPLSVPVEETQEAGTRFLCVTVPKGATFYANAAGTATRRLARNCIPFTPAEQHQAAAARGYFDWSAESSGVSRDALAAEEIARLRRLLVLAGRDDLSRLDDPQLLRDLRLSLDDDSVTRAGMLLLGKESELAATIPTYGYAYQYRQSPGSESTARLRGARPILAAVELLLDAVGARSQTHSISIEGGVQLQIRDYPQEAIREVVVNAFIHRDFEQGAAVEVEHSAEALSVTSAGGLVYGVTPENILTHPSTPRHRLLMETVTLLQVAERSGQGIDRTYRELLRAGKPPPTILDDGVQVRVVLPGGTGNDAFARFVANLDGQLGGDVEVLLALSHLRDRRSINASQLAALAQRSPAEAKGVLDRLAHVSLIEATRRTARRGTPTYVLTGEALTRLGRAVRYHYRRTDDTDRKIIEQVREYGFVTNVTLRRMFNVDVYTARNLLQSLRERGVLEKLDAARGGPGIRYGLRSESATRGMGITKEGLPTPVAPEDEGPLQLEFPLSGADDAKAGS
jgi:ATP-dependent DNA helicase RecG